MDDRDGGPTAVDETDLDVWQLFLQHDIPLRTGDRLAIRVGRQQIETANVFITAGEANNIRLSYDGIRIAIPDGATASFDAFYAEYVDYADGAFDMSGTGEYFWGVNAGHHFDDTDLNIHVAYLGWELKDRQFEQGDAQRFNERRHSLMLWFNRPLQHPQRWGLDYYLVYQFGHYEDSPGGSDIEAYAAFGGFQYALSRADNPLILGLKTSYFSGDRDPTDNELNTFYNPVFGTPYFGYARDVMPFNLIHLQPNLSYRFGQVTATLSHEFLWRASTEDGYYNGPNGITVRATDSESARLGQQTQFALRYRPRPSVILSSYVGYLFAGEVIKDAGGADRTYVHLGINYLF